jgi:phosphoribosylanthranilate isomerase
MNPTADELESLMAGNIFDGVQLHGDEPASIATSIRDAGYLVIRAVPIGLGAPEHDWLSYPCDYRLADTYHDGQSGGTGKRLDPSLIPGSDHRGPQPLLIAGGLTPLNVEQAMNQFPAQGVDVSSGVEVSPGIKDHEAIRTFVTRAKALNPINLDR